MKHATIKTKSLLVQFARSWVANGDGNNDVEDDYGEVDERSLETVCGGVFAQDGTKESRRTLWHGSAESTPALYLYIITTEANELQTDLLEMGKRLSRGDVDK